MKIVVIDGQGGRLGKTLVEKLRAEIPEAEICAIGTNSIAASVMNKAGAHASASGENPVVVACRDADVIVGPVGIVIADSLLGEVTPRMALAVGQSRAKKVLLPVNRCETHIVGLADLSVSRLVAEAVGYIRGLMKQPSYTSGI